MEDLGMGYGSSDYNSGYSSGKSAGQSEERSRIRGIEQESLARVLSIDPNFREGVRTAQQKLAGECGYISSYVDQSKITVDTGGFLGIERFSKHADPSQSSQVIADAEKLLHDKLLSEALELSDDQYVAAAKAFLNVSYGEGNPAPNHYELGRATEYVASLTDKDFFGAGYTGRVANISTTLDSVHNDGDWTKWLIGDEDKNAAVSPVQQDKHYRKFLIDAVQDIAPTVAEKVNAVLHAGPPPFVPKAASPAPGLR
jgi:hypothetical protein